jgi:uncharacterized protein
MIGIIRLRVYGLCERIGKAEGADMVVVKIAAYLHDIGRSVQDQSAGKVCHAAEGAKLAREIVGQLPLSDFQKDNIIHCVRSHRFRGGEMNPKPLRPKCFLMPTSSIPSGR